MAINPSPIRLHPLLNNGYMLASLPYQKLLIYNIHRVSFQRLTLSSSREVDPSFSIFRPHPNPQHEARSPAFPVSPTPSPCPPAPTKPSPAQYFSRGGPLSNWVFRSAVGSCWVGRVGRWQLGREDMHSWLQYLVSFQRIVLGARCKLWR